ncbi:Calponin-homology (CH) domain-containing protein [Heracleum sosnowskyi]|uniref:Calponin-homology (CH) domain-containing protein n=1 Tax=Heracleum sosnowskyi TaxID=360622 RepID=A0AAD8MD17_9APIA|nr:Calponin-homology (CH) domain-containing protein [Heracleum sosnowskyi]
MWRGSKRQRDEMWCNRDGKETTLFSNSMFSELRESLKEVCSFDDFKERMGVYLSLGSCKEIFDVMTHVTKNTDSGRIKMKSNCSIVIDVGMKQKALRVLMCYHPIWLRIGLYIIFGGNTLLPNGDVTSEQEISFLKMVMEKQLFTHAGLAEFYVYNKLVAGLYRPGYFEKLGGIILKRFLLLVLILDRAKCQSSLPLNHGIDGLDGGSPLLFTLQSNVKSSQQMIQDFLTSDVMHGEGNLLAHLVIVGFKVFYVQCPLSEYDFRITNLFEDLQDRVRLCRAVQLLQHDSSILTKLVFPSDTRNKNVMNCGLAFQHLKQAGVALYDEDGTVIVGEDIVNGDKELTLSLLWNIFAPLLVNQFLLSEEIHKVRRIGVELSDTCTSMDMLLHWVQAICESYDCKVDNFASMVDGRAMWCLLDYYFRSDNHLPCSSNISNGMYEEHTKTSEEASIMCAANYTDAVHNFLMSQKLTTLLGKFPEVLQVSDLLEHNGVCNDRSVMILLVFLSYHMVVKRNTDQLNFHKFLGYNCPSSGRKHHNKGIFEQSEAIENIEYHDTTHDFKAIMA